MRVLRLFVSGVALVVAAACCASPTSPSGSVGAGALQIQVDGKNQLQVGEQSSMKATATFGDGPAQDVTKSATWISDNGNVCSINASGVATGVGLGTCTVTAVVRDTTGNHPISVLLPNTPGNPGNPGNPGDPTNPNPPTNPPNNPNPPPTPPGVSLTGVAVQGASTVVAGQTTPWKAIAIYSNGTQTDVTSFSSWSSSAPSIASVSNGIVTGVTPGTANISATFAGKTATGSILVTASGGPVAPTVTSLTVSGTTSIVTGQSTQWTAIANFSNGTSLNVTAASTWTSGTPGVATVVAGVVTGVSAGSSLISASFGGQSGSGTVQVTQAAPQLIGIEVDLGVNVLTSNSPNAPFNLNLSLADILNGNPILDLKVWGLYSNGSKQDVTNAAVIDRSQQLLSIDGQGTAAVILLLVQGLINPNHYVNVTYGGYTANVNVTLNLPVLQSLKLNNGQPITLSAGNQLPSLQGLFSQGIQSDINANVPGVQYTAVLGGGVLQQLQTLASGNPILGLLLNPLLSQITQVVNGLSVVDGVLTLAPGLGPTLNSILNNSLFQALGGSNVLPIDLTATLNGVTTTPVRLNLTGS